MKAGVVCLYPPLLVKRKHCRFCHGPVLCCPALSSRRVTRPNVQFCPRSRFKNAVQSGGGGAVIRLQDVAEIELESSEFEGDLILHAEEE